MHIKLALVFMLACYTVDAQAQRQVKRIKRLYEQGMFEKSLKKAEKRIADHETAQEALPYFYQALNLAELSQQPDKTKKYPHALRNALMAYQQYLLREPGGQAAKVHPEAFEAFHQLILTEGNRLHHAGEKAEARFFQTALANIWKDETDIYLTHYQTQPKLPETGSVATAAVTSASLLRDSIVMTANTCMGVPYKYGGTSPKGFDCSGFTGYAFSQHNIELPRKSDDQFSAGKQIPVELAQRGDLAFFGQKKGHDVKITHVAIVISNPGEPLRVIHATSSKGVLISDVSLSNYWRPRLLFIVDVVEPDDAQ